VAFNSWAEFWAMGTHGIYVWSCYGLTFTVIALLVLHTRQQRQRFFRAQIQQLKREQQQHES